MPVMNHIGAPDLTTVYHLKEKIASDELSVWSKGIDV